MTQIQSIKAKTEYMTEFFIKSNANSFSTTRNVFVTL